MVGSIMVVEGERDLKGALSELLALGGGVVRLESSVGLGRYLLAPTCAAGLVIVAHVVAVSLVLAYAPLPSAAGHTPSVEHAGEWLACRSASLPSDGSLSYAVRPVSTASLAWAAAALSAVLVVLAVGYRIWPVWSLGASLPPWLGGSAHGLVIGGLAAWGAELVLTGGSELVVCWRCVPWVSLAVRQLACLPVAGVCALLALVGGVGIALPAHMLAVLNKERFAVRSDAPTALRMVLPALTGLGRREAAERRFALGGLVLLIVACALIVGSAVHASPEIAAAALLLAWIGLATVLLRPAASIFLFAKRTVLSKYRAQAPDLAAVRASDPRPHVVFFRSFRLDEWLVDDPLAGLPREVREPLYFAEAIVDELRRLGPVIALVDPRAPTVVDRGPLGLFAADLSKSGWQAAAERMLEGAACVVLVLDDSAAVRWELRRVATEPLDRIVLIPSSARGTEWHFGDAAFPPPVAERIRGAAGVLVTRDGLVVTSRPSGEHLGEARELVASLAELVAHLETRERLRCLGQ